MQATLQHLGPTDELSTVTERSQRKEWAFLWDTRDNLSSKKIYKIGSISEHNCV